MLSLLSTGPAPGADPDPCQTWDTRCRILPQTKLEPGSPVLRFVEQLRAIVKSRDPDALLAVMTDEVRVSNRQIEEASVRQYLQLDLPSSQAWSDLDYLLKTEGDFIDPAQKDYCIPFVHAGLPDWMTKDPDFRLAGAKTPLFQDSNFHAPQNGDISNQVVKVLSETESRNAVWLKVQKADGAAGYVPADFLYDSFTTSLCLKNDGGAWRISSFIWSLD